MTAAMALPGLAAPLHAAEGYRSDDFNLEYNHATYSESGDRMAVEVDQVSLTAPMADRFELKFTAIRDLVSGASPAVNTLDGNGEPVQNLQSGASIKDQRDVYEASLGYYGDDHYLAVGVGRSLEDDYDARYGNVQYRRDLPDTNAALLFSAAYSDDEVWNSYDPTKINVTNKPSAYHHRSKRDLMIGVSQILNKRATVQFNLTQSHGSGHLSDPYKKAYVADMDLISRLLPASSAASARANAAPAISEGDIPINPAEILDWDAFWARLFGLVPDNRPDTRDQWLAVVRYRQFLPEWDAALHLDYRFTLDQWEADSHTFEVRLKKRLWEGWTLAPGVRYYSQHSAYFYDVFFATTPGDGYLSSDYRLAGFGAISWKLALSAELSENFGVQLNYEHYDRRHAWELTDSKGDVIDDFSTDLVSFTLKGVF